MIRRRPRSTLLPTTLFRSHAGRGYVSLMLHTFLGENLEQVKAAVREPLIEYLRQSADLIRGYAWAFSAFKPSARSMSDEIGRAHVELQSRLHLVCRLLLE